MTLEKIILINLTGYVIVILKFDSIKSFFKFNQLILQYSEEKLNTVKFPGLDENSLLLLLVHNYAAKI